jgi:thioredoxin-related protein
LKEKNVKHWICLLLFASVCYLGKAQSSEQPAYKRYPTIPPLELEQLDHTTITKDNIKKNQPTIIMYFSPVCEHCKHQMDDMIKRMNDLKKYQIILATYQPQEDMVVFDHDYQLAKYPNIKMGRDNKFVLPPFYSIRSLPYLALYDKKGNLIRTFEGNVKIDTLLHAFGK